MENEFALVVDGVWKKYCTSLKRSMQYGISDIGRNVLGFSSSPATLRQDEFWAVSDVSFKLKRGETLGVIGHNGSGKTTLLKMLNGIFWPDRGKITVTGRSGALIEVGAGFHPLLTGRENISINAAILGMSKEELKRKFDSIIDFAEIGDFLDTPVKNYSSGMYVRLGFAVAVHCEPDILLIDEVLSVGDASFRAKCYDVIYTKLRNTATVFVSHDMSQIRRICGSVVLMNHGKASYYANTAEGIAAYADNVLHDGEMRYASGVSLIENIEVKALNAGNTILTGSCVKITFDLNLSKEIEDATVILSILASDRTPVAFSKTIDGAVRNEGSASKVGLIINELPLSAGCYSLSIAIFDENTNCQVLWYYNVAPFRVEGSSDYVVPVQLIGKWVSDLP